MRKTVTTWICNLCGIESEPLKPGITFNWDYSSPKGWVIYRDPPIKQNWNGIEILVDPCRNYGLGNDPALIPDNTCHFCCEAHKTEWLKAHEDKRKQLENSAANLFAD